MDGLRALFMEEAVRLKGLGKLPNLSWEEIDVAIEKRSKEIVQKSIEELSYEKIRHHMKELRINRDTDKQKPGLGSISPLSIYRRRRSLIDLYDEARFNLARRLFVKIEGDLKIKPLFPL